MMNFNKYVLLLLSLMLQSLPLHARDTAQKSMAVLDFRAPEAAVMDADLARTLLEESFITKNYLILEHSEKEFLREIRKQKRFKKNSRKNAVKIGNFLSLDLVVMGSISITDQKRLHLKIVDVKNNTIISSRSYVYTKEKPLTRLIPEISDGIEHDIQQSRIYPLQLFASYAYFVPQKELQEVIATGNGFSLLVAYELPFVRHALLGGELQYFYIRETSEVTHHAELLPLTFFLGYEFSYNDFYFIPYCSYGKSYNSLYYYTAYETADFSDYTRRSTWDRLYKCGFKTGHTLYGPLSVFIGVEYALLSGHNNNTFMTYNTGVRFKF